MPKRMFISVYLMMFYVAEEQEQEHNFPREMKCFRNFNLILSSQLQMALKHFCFVSKTTKKSKKTFHFSFFSFIKNEQKTNKKVKISWSKKKKNKNKKWQSQLILY